MGPLKLCYPPSHTSESSQESKQPTLWSVSWPQVTELLPVMHTEPWAQGNEMVENSPASGWPSLALRSLFSGNVTLRLVGRTMFYPWPLCVPRSHMPEAVSYCPSLSLWIWPDYKEQDRCILLLARRVFGDPSKQLRQSRVRTGNPCGAGLRDSSGILGWVWGT
jgi:hypothetical protein